MQSSIQIIFLFYRHNILYFKQQLINHFGTVQQLNLIYKKKITANIINLLLPSVMHENGDRYNILKGSRKFLLDH